MTKIQFGMTVTALAITAAFLAVPLLVGAAKSDGLLSARVAHRSQTLLDQQWHRQLQQRRQMCWWRSEAFICHCCSCGEQAEALFHRAAKY
jgi:hypothetical protein